MTSVEKENCRGHFQIVGNCYRPAACKFGGQGWELVTGD
jgi:hypothetical protein